MLYFDTSYLVRLYTSDPGWEQVRALAGTDRLACCLHGRAETVAAFHRKLREGVILGREFTTLLAEFVEDIFRAHRGRYGAKRTTGARKMKGLEDIPLFVLRDLQLNLFG